MKTDWKYFHPCFKILSFKRQLPFVISAVYLASTLRHWVLNSSANLSASDLLVTQLLCFRIGSRNPESLNVISFFFFFFVTFGSHVSNLAYLKVISHLRLCSDCIFVYTKLTSKNYFSSCCSYYCCCHLGCTEEHIYQKLSEVFI